MRLHELPAETMRAASEPSVEVPRHRTEIASCAAEGDVSVGPHQVLSAVLVAPNPQSHST
jgi:hypothetical protein